jgi:outer membrane lipoprotein LolB
LIRVSKRLAQRLALAVACAGVMACSTLTAPRQLPVDGQGFRLEGRIAVRYGSENLSGRIAWTHLPARDEVDLATPLGNQVAQLLRTAAMATLTDSQQRVSSAPDVETLTERQLGWRLPLAGLSLWVRGIVVGPADAVQRDPKGRMEKLHQAGWQVDYAYDDASGSDLPRRLIMKYERGAEPLEIRIVVDRWEPAPG